ncbi:hypothetical protein J40TS1_33250 [Paenibacillus montaniterrae]|uniref:Copper amine oxidase-like N-terminal domain-containing protein n=1 Tax=Paenibacillus montaniterrae TaxID=429341 RepID=A0A919YPJ2_9BACL|nr:copper amine oxidase N-terminal domain-containing protein [Paenibacillus montaniterrae]GIP17683.1 hypothetical protein J40TS1_33250 [Paenibacillus montaniterrae]
MKKALLTAIIFCLIMIGLPQAMAHASTNTVKVKEVKGDAILLEDGTLWLKKPQKGFTKYQTNAATIRSQDSSPDSIGLTEKGELVYWGDKNTPTVDKKQTNIKQLDGNYYVKHDGTVWNTDGQQYTNYSDVVILGNGAFFNKKGELRNSSDGYVLATVDDPESIVSLKATEDFIAFLDKNGKVTALSDYDFEVIDGVVVYNTYVVAENAVSIDFHPSDALIVTKKDGTAWITAIEGTYKDKFKLVEQIKDIKDAVQVSDYYGTLAYDPEAGRDSDETIIVTTERNKPQWLVKHKDGSWKIYRDNKVYPIEAPTITGLSLTASNSKLAVGNTVSFKPVQTYSNGYKETLSGAKLTFDKPYLVKALSNGSYKAVAVGETKVSVTENGSSKSVTISISASSNLTGAVSKDNTTYLPLVSVFKALGATVSNKDGKTFDVSLGDTKLQLKTGQKKAKLNGKDITLNQAVQVHNGTTVFPAALLTKASIAKLDWDSKYKKMKITIGKAALVVESAETAAIEKKEKQGNLTQFINKSYWVNRYSDWERFMKLTVTDIVPTSGDNFQVVFKNANGKTYKMKETSRDFVSGILNDSDTFLSFDPYKKYSWSTSTWNMIKAEKIAVGMSKTQVELSWGRPSSTSKLSSSGITVEVWRYGTQYVSFTNGIVQSIYTY